MNRPEVNQKLSKKTVLKEYNEEIERLRKELFSVREQQGVYIALDNYHQMMAEVPVPSVGDPVPYWIRIQLGQNPGSGSKLDVFGSADRQCHCVIL